MGGELLHMNKNLDSTNIIINGHKIVGVSSYDAFYYQHARSHIYAHINIFRLRGGVYPRVTNTYMYMCQRYPVYTC